MESKKEILTKTKTMTKLTEKHIWYKDSDNVSLPFDSCIVRLPDTHVFCKFPPVQNHISTAKSNSEDCLFTATKIPGRHKSYFIQLIVSQKLRSYEDSEDYTQLSYKSRLVCNLGTFQYVSENTSQELKRLTKRKETNKRYGL